MTDPTPAPLPPAQPAGTWLVQFGDIAVGREWLSTPAGVAPLKGTVISFVDRTVPVTKIPTWAVIVAIVGFFVIFLLSLLFLLVKETVPAGAIDVTVRNEETGSIHTTSLPIASIADRADLYARVGYAQQLAAAA